MTIKAMTGIPTVAEWSGSRSSGSHVVVRTVECLQDCRVEHSFMVEWMMIFLRMLLVLLEMSLGRVS